MLWKRYQFGLTRIAVAVGNDINFTSVNSSEPSRLTVPIVVLATFAASRVSAWERFPFSCVFWLDAHLLGHLVALLALGTFPLASMDVGLASEALFISQVSDF